MILIFDAPDVAVSGILNDERANERETKLCTGSRLPYDVRKEAIPREAFGKNLQIRAWNGDTYLSLANFRKIVMASSPKYHGSRPFSSPAP